MLRQHKAEQEVERNLVGKPLADSAPVFSHLDGSPLAPHVVSHVFSKIIHSAGLPHIHWHDLRHSHATLLLKGGVQPKIVSERLGQVNIGITLDTYSHVLPGLQKAAAERFDKMLEPRVGAENVSKMFERALPQIAWAVSSVGRAPDF